jgi:hypothetical protein
MFADLIAYLGLLRAISGIFDEKWPVTAASRSVVSLYAGT